MSCYINITLTVPPIVLQVGVSKYSSNSINFFFSLLVESGPQVALVPMGTYYMADKTYALHCTARGYPLPDVTWLFQKCDQYPKCDIDFTEVRVSGTL